MTPFGATACSSLYGPSGTNCWGEEYSYDAWANLFQISPPAGYTGCQVETLSILISANNQAGGFSYDGAGNVANDTHNAYTWNAESEVKTAAGVTYSYDGLGNRVGNPGTDGTFSDTFPGKSP